MRDGRRVGRSRGPVSVHLGSFCPTAAPPRARGPAPPASRYFPLRTALTEKGDWRRLSGSPTPCPRRLLALPFSYARGSPGGAKMAGRGPGRGAARFRWLGLGPALGVPLLDLAHLGRFFGLTGPFLSLVPGARGCCRFLVRAVLRGGREDGGAGPRARGGAASVNRASGPSGLKLPGPRSFWASWGSGEVALW